MHATGRLFLLLAALILCGAAAFGAYGAHGLAATVSAADWQAYMTAVDYQFFHGLGLCVIAVLIDSQPGSRGLQAAGYAFLAGIVLFCGGIYATTFGAAASVGRIVPFGGVAFILGWLLLGAAALFARKRGPADPLT